MNRKYITKEEYLAGVINSIADTYPELRKKSKTVTFALQYKGTWHTLVNKTGFPKTEAKKIDQAYKDTYQVSIQWTANKIAQAAKKGYVELAYGGRLQTPVLAQTVLGNRATPSAADAEARSAGNALTQSYCFLNIDTLVRFMENVWKSEYRYTILPIASIHDNNLFTIENSYTSVKFFNDEYIKCLQNYSIPLLEHPIIKLTGETEIMHYDWSNPVKLSHGMSIQELYSLCHLL